MVDCDHGEPLDNCFIILTYFNMHCNVKLQFSFSKTKNCQLVDVYHSQGWDFYW